MAKGNGANGAAGAKPPAWWQAAKDQLKNELKTELKQELMSELMGAINPRFESIETKLVVMDMKIDALDRRVTRLEERG